MSEPLQRNQFRNAFVDKSEDTGPVTIYLNFGQKGRGYATRIALTKGDTNARIAEELRRVADYLESK